MIFIRYYIHFKAFELAEKSGEGPSTSFRVTTVLEVTEIGGKSLRTKKGSDGQGKVREFEKKKRKVKEF